MLRLVAVAVVCCVGATESSGCSSDDDKNSMLQFAKNFKIKDGTSEVTELIGEASTKKAQPEQYNARPRGLRNNACDLCVCMANPNGIESPPGMPPITDAICSQCSFGGHRGQWPCNGDSESLGLCECGGTPAGVFFDPLPETPQEGNGKCTAGPDDCSFEAGAGISSWFTRALFHEAFPNLCNSACHGCEMLTYNCLIKATLDYPDLANSGDLDDDKRELAAWMGIMGQETTGGGCAESTQLPDGTCSCGHSWCDSNPNGGCSAWGLCFVEEVVEEASRTYCSGSNVYPCVDGEAYKGRGPKQLSWNYNYGQFSEEYCGDKNILLDNPGWVASNPTLAWASSIWFWFSGGACLPGESCKPSPHDVFTGSKTMCEADGAAGRKYGLGWATNVVNGGLECPGNGRCDSRVHSRVRFYKHFCDVLGVGPYKAGWDDDNLFCSDQQNYVDSPPTEC